ncbi:MAG: DUF1493 family protein [Pantoea sp.]|uniref:DUF1493 family protein n=1 Tax=Pantoea sp. TaxID=69393 RepID=UPI0039E5E283
MLSGSIDAKVMEWYDNTFNKKPLFSKTKPAVTMETSLSTGDYPWERSAGDEIMKDYFSRFNVESESFDFVAYWPYEKGLLPNLLRPKSQKVANTEPKPLTIRMLIESAKAGRWLYS